MSRMLVLGVIVVIALVGSAPTSSAQAVAVSTPGYVAPTDGETDAAYVRFEAPSALLRAWSDVAYVAVEFESDLDLGDEVELYAAENAEVTPWSRETPPARTLWVVGTKTGDLVRFDLTELVRTHGQEEKALVLYVRRAPDEDGAVASLGANETLGLTLTAHRGSD